MSVKCFKLISGEELIGDVISDFKDVILKVQTPASVHMLPNQNGTSVSMALMPFLPYADEDTFIIPKEALSVMPFDPSVEFLNRYNQMFGSGIQIAKGSFN
jgi:hypothetical protein